MVRKPTGHLLILFARAKNVGPNRENLSGQVEFYSMAWLFYRMDMPQNEFYENPNLGIRKPTHCNGLTLDNGRS
jgi:hypothetical protein